MGSFAEAMFYFMGGVFCLGVAVLIGVGCICAVFDFIQYIKEEKRSGRDEDNKRKRK